MAEQKKTKPAAPGTKGQGAKKDGKSPKGGKVAAPKAASEAKESKEKKEETTQEGPLSISDLDALINEADPEFSNSLKEIGKDLNTDQEIDSVDIGAFDDSNALPSKNEDQEKKRKDTRIKKIIHFFLAKLEAFVQAIIFRLTVLAIRAVDWVIYFVKEGRKTALEDIKISVRKVLKVADSIFDQIWERSWKEKLAFFFVLALAAGLYHLIKGKMHGEMFVPKIQQEFLGSFAEVADHEYSFDVKREFEPFYDSFRYAENIMLVDKIKVNIRRSPKSGPNPMAMLEFYVVGYSGDAVIEVKDRQNEILDLAQRVLEEFTYDQLDENGGKAELKKEMIKAFNKVLTTGRLKDLLIRTLILKP